MASGPSRARQRETCARWLGTLSKYRHDFAAPAHPRHWSPPLETCSRDELRSIQNDKLVALTPFPYENIWELVDPDTLAKTEFKARRVRDERTA